MKEIDRLRRHHILKLPFVFLYYLYIIIYYHPLIKLEDGIFISFLFLLHSVFFSFNLVEVPLFSIVAITYSFSKYIHFFTTIDLVRINESTSGVKLATKSGVSLKHGSIAYSELMQAYRLNPQTKDLGDSIEFIDNMSTLQLLMNPVHHQQYKHIDIKFR